MAGLSGVLHDLAAQVLLAPVRLHVLEVAQLTAAPDKPRVGVACAGVPGSAFS